MKGTRRLRYQQKRKIYNRFLKKRLAGLFVQLLQIYFMKKKMKCMPTIFPAKRYNNLYLQTLINGIDINTID